MTQEKAAGKRSDNALAMAVKALRVGLGDTQQKFATRLGIAISTAVRYESTRPPSGEALSQLYWLSVDQGLADVAAMFHHAVFNEWRDWGGVPASERVTENLENRFVRALSDDLGPRGPATSTRIGEWSFMRCAQKVLLEDQYKHLRAPFVALVAPMCEELVEEAKQTLSEMLESAPQREELIQGLMVQFVDQLPSEFFNSRGQKKENLRTKEGKPKKSK